jgi:hypothetical protein
VETVFGFIKKSKGFPTILAFSGISHNCFCIGEVIDRVHGTQDHNWLSVHGGLTTMGWCGRFRAREVVVIARRERKSSGFSPMAPLGGGVVEMVVGGAPMGRRFWARGGEI